MPKIYRVEKKFSLFSLIYISILFKRENTHSIFLIKPSITIFEYPFFCSRSCTSWIHVWLRRYFIIRICIEISLCGEFSTSILRSNFHRREIIYRGGVRDCHHYSQQELHHIINHYNIIFCRKVCLVPGSLSGLRRNILLTTPRHNDWWLDEA